MDRKPSFRENEKTETDFKWGNLALKVPRNSHNEITLGSRSAEIGHETTIKTNLVKFVRATSK